MTFLTELVVLFAIMVPLTLLFWWLIKRDTKKYKGALPTLAWASFHVSMGFWAAIELFAAGSRDTFDLVTLSGVLACSSIGIALIAYKRVRDDRMFGAGAEIPRWIAWILLGTSGYWMIAGFRVLNTSP